MFPRCSRIIYVCVLEWKSFTPPFLLILDVGVLHMVAIEL
jgi:hypothetical protein